jgi:hypothetical protein
VCEGEGVIVDELHVEPDMVEDDVTLGDADPVIVCEDVRVIPEAVIVVDVDTLDVDDVENVDVTDCEGVLLVEGDSEPDPVTEEEPVTRSDGVAVNESVRLAEGLIVIHV